MAQKDSEALIERVEVAEEDVADMAEAPETRHITRELTEVSQRTGIDITIDADGGAAGNGRHTGGARAERALDISVLENIWEILGNSSGCLRISHARTTRGRRACGWNFEKNGVLDKYSSFEEMDAAISELLAEAATKSAEPVFFPESPMDVMQTGEKLHDTNMYDCYEGYVTFYGWSDQETVYKMGLNATSDGGNKFTRDIEMNDELNSYQINVNPLNIYLPAIERGEFKIQLPERSIEDAQAYAEQLLAELGSRTLPAWSRASHRCCARGRLERRTRIRVRMSSCSPARSRA